MRQYPENITHAESGFTLIEVIISLVLVGIMTAVAGMGLVYVAESFIFTRMNATTMQKEQMAMARIVLELNNISSIFSPSTGDTMTFYSYKDDVKKKRVVRLNDDNDTIEIDDGDGNYYTLTDQIATSNGFSLQYYANYNDSVECYPPSAKVIVVTLRMAGANSSTQVFVERVTPRNI